MLFNTSLFALFLLVVLCLYHFVLVTPSQRIWLFLISSLVFYAGFSWWFLPLLIGTALFDFWIARLIDRTEVDARRKLLVAGSLVVNLGVLGYFKYCNFFLRSGAELLSFFGHPVDAPVLRIVLPVGISFYTFQSISYVVDVYRGMMLPHASFRTFLAAITFFPHLVAGPIVRSSGLLPQFERMEAPRWSGIQAGYLLIAAGLVKKSIADLLAPHVELAFAADTPHGWLESWTATVAFAAQVYGDFSGYTDIAIGVAAVFGVALPQNFNLPYLAWSPIEFWNRWHISLSTWLRDYLYTPLALALRRWQAFCLLLTWLLGGLWHGANWTFVVWGLFHGGVLVVTHAVAKVAPQRVCGPTRSVPLRVAKSALTFYLVLIGYSFFRAPTVVGALEVIRGMHALGPSSTVNPRSISVFALAVVALVSCHLLDYMLRHVQLFRRATPAWAMLAASVAFSVLFGVTGEIFIYFNF